MKNSLIYRTLIAAVGMTCLSSVGADLTKSEISLKLQTISNAHPKPIQVLDVEDSPLSGFYQILTDKGILYASKDGAHLISGSVHTFDSNMNDLTKPRLLVERKKEISQLESDFITYRAPKEKHEVIVFYDTTCGYCHKLHSEIQNYKDAGITVHYAAFPRSGVSHPRNPSIKSEGFLALQDIWCAENANKNVAFDLVSMGKQIPRKQCGNSIERQYNLGVKLGIQGTPAIIGMNGEMVSAGYTPANELIKRLSQASL